MSLAGLRRAVVVWWHGLSHFGHRTGTCNYADGRGTRRVHFCLDCDFVTPREEVDKALWAKVLLQR